MTELDTVYYLRHAAISWLEQNQEDPNAPMVREAIRETGRYFEPLPNPLKPHTFKACGPGVPDRDCLACGLPPDHPIHIKGETIP